MPGITTSWVEVTPALAQEWLDKHNIGNRRVIEVHVARIAADIKAGRYVPTHQGIAFNVNNELVDGQHRLLAVVAAGVPVMLLVARNVPVSARPKIDSGQTRSLAQVLEMSYGLSGSKAKVAWVGSIVRMLEGNARKLSDGEAMELVAVYADGIAWAETAFASHRKRLCRASVIGALIYAHAVDPTRVDIFARQLVSGESLVRGSPVLPVREFLMGARHYKQSGERDVSLHVLNALEAFLDGTPRVLTRATEGSLDFFTKARAKK